MGVGDDDDNNNICEPDLLNPTTELSVLPH